MAKRSQTPRGAPRTVASAKKTGRPGTSSGLLLVAAIVAAVIVVAGIVLLQNQAARRPTEISGRIGTGTSWGSPDAKVQIIVYSDFGCSHCGDFALDQGKRLRQDYETGGDVSFEYKHFIISPPDTANAANAAECAADQGRFWDYHDLLYSQQGVSRSPFAKAALKRYAVQIGLDSRQFDTCVDRDSHLDKVYRDSAAGRDAGVTGTPTFYINGQKLAGAVPYEQLKAEVEAALR